MQRVRGALKEAVFSSSEDRIRATQATPAVDGSSVASCGVRPAHDVHWLRHATEGLFSVLFPSDCRICGLPLLSISRLPVCHDCLAAIEPLQPNICSICGERVLSSYALCDDDGICRCPVCRRIDRPFKRAVAYGSYEGGLRELVHLLKFHGVRPAANVLGRMLAEAITQFEPSFGRDTVLVIPVPLFRGKRRQRGFNQAEMIARAMIKASPARERLQLATGVLLRTRETHSQIGLTSHQRRENLRGAFLVARAPEIIGHEVLLVDDVYTTGTTASECARVLRRAGADKVWVATVARTLKLASKNQGFGLLKVQGFEGNQEMSEALEPETFGASKS
ncbi:MAG: ComF family protein [Candidatus Sulfotelmatobacter sp.]